jgi:hypothetical protein
VYCEGREKKVLVCRVVSVLEILIGGDHYWNRVKDTSQIGRSPSALLLPSKFGWELSGNRSAITVSPNAVKYINLEQTLPSSDDNIRLFWELETLGIKDFQMKTPSAKHPPFSGSSRHRTLSMRREEWFLFPGRKTSHYRAIVTTRTKGSMR